MPFGIIAAAGWASGINLYATTFLLGLAGRLDWADTPSALQHTWLLVVTGFMYVVEFVVDKVPLLDSAWDLLHTAIRPIGGALIGGALATDAGSSEVIAALLGGGFSLSAHSAKASTRAAVNLSPEPFTNIGLSIFEDGIVAGLVILALDKPGLAAALAIVFATISVVVVWLLVRAVRRFISNWQTRRRDGRRQPIPLR